MMMRIEAVTRLLHSKKGDLSFTKCENKIAKFNDIALRRRGKRGGFKFVSFFQFIFQAKIRI